MREALIDKYNIKTKEGYDRLNNKLQTCILDKVEFFTFETLRMALYLLRKYKKRYNRWGLIGLAELITTLISDEYLDHNNLKSRTLEYSEIVKKILVSLSVEGEITISLISKVYDIPYHKCRKIMFGLLEMGLIKKKGQTWSAKYLLCDDLDFKELWQKNVVPKI